MGADDSATHPITFICAHELAHNLNNDNIYPDLVKKIFGIASTILIREALLSTLAPQDLLTEMNLNLITALAGVTLGKSAYNFVMRYAEQRADLDACKILNTFEIKGGVEWLRMQQGINKTYKNRQDLSFGDRLWSKIALTAEGDYRFDFSHPPLSQRIRYMEALLKQQQPLTKM